MSLIIKLPHRMVEHRPAKSTIRFFHKETGIVKTTPSSEQYEELDENLPEILHGCIISFLSEHCIYTDKEYIWQELQKGNINSAINQAINKVLSHKEKIHELFSISGGIKIVTGHLISAEYWDEIVKEICEYLNMNKYYEKLVSRNRPRGGMPLFDEAMRVLGELVERGDWEY